MTNKLNETKKTALPAAAIITALVFALAGLGVGLGFAVRDTVAPSPETRMSSHLLYDAASGLVNSSSALRLCTEKETADDVSGKALVYAVRAETALECEGGDWCDCRSREAFLNDACALLGAGGKTAMSKADALYDFSVAFRASLSGGEFEYDGELETVRPHEYKTAEPSGEQIEGAKKTLSSVLGIEGATYVGGFDDRLEFDIEGGGYAEVEGGRIPEFALEKGVPCKGGAEDAALEIADRCGYGELEVFTAEDTEDGTLVKMCTAINGAMCRDECAGAVIKNGAAVAFTAGKCGKSHELPAVKVSEETARKAAHSDRPGRLVTTFDGERDRVCYEYRCDMEDGVHYVYICAENGKQMEVR